MRGAISMAGVFRGLICAGLAIVVAGGCAGKEKPAALEPPPTVIRLAHFTGTTISGPLSPAAPVGDAQSALAVSFTIIAMDNAPTNDLLPLGSLARLIHASADGHAMRPSTRLTLGTRLAVYESLAAAMRFDQSGSAAPMAQARGALPAGVTAALSVADASAPDRRDRFVEIAVTRRTSAEVATQPAAPTIELAVVIQDWVPENPDTASPLDAPTTAPSRRARRADGEAPDVVPPPMVLQREVAVLDPLAVDSPRTLALVIPFSFSDRPAGSLGVVIYISPGNADDESHVEALARCADELAQSAAVTGAAHRDDASARQWPEFYAALTAMGQPASRRSAIVFLAGQTGASICQDAALVCDDLTLEQLSKTITDRAAAQPPQSRDRDALGWLLDYTALELISSLATSNRLSDELSAVLVRHAGQVGRAASSVQQLLKDASSRPDLDRRLLAENLLYLEDSSPAARVRAYDWLASRRAAPADYDPLADNKQRRAALDAAIQAMQETKGNAP